VGAASCSPALCSLAASGNGNGAAVGPVGSGAEVACTRRMLHVVLVSPLIPGNTGSIARTCAASAVGLHLVGPLGFKVDDTKLKRAGLDYWPYPFLGYKLSTKYDTQWSISIQIYIFHPFLSHQYATLITTTKICCCQDS